MMRGRSTKQKRSAARRRDIETLLRCAVTPEHKGMAEEVIDLMYSVREPVTSKAVKDYAATLRRGEMHSRLTGEPNPGVAEVFDPCGLS